MKTILRILAVALAGGVLLLATSWAFAPGGRIEPPAPGVRAARHDVYNPVTAGEPLPEGFRQLLPRDGIQPIYDPQFTSATAVDWPGETQVIGVAAGGEAKAYPVSFLDQHEMVNDFIAGDPISGDHCALRRWSIAASSTARRLCLECGERFSATP